MNNVNEAIVIMVGDRYLIGFDKGGRVQTAWSLAGATIFAPWNTNATDSAISRLLKKKKKAQVLKISCSAIGAGVTV